MLNLLYQNIKDKHGKKTSFLILLAFLITFILARLYAALMLFDWISDRHIIIRNIHIHHYNFGIIFLALSGILALWLGNSRFRGKIAILYGIGLGLTFDEFAMWLHLEDHYWMRASYDAIIIISIILINAAFFGDFWLRIFRKIKPYLYPFYLKVNRTFNISKSLIKTFYQTKKPLFYSIILIMIILVALKIKR